MHLSRKHLSAAIAGAVLIAGGTTIAIASIPDSSGVIHGCRDLKTGQLRVIDTDQGQVCVKGETALTWSQTGPQGPPGTSSVTPTIATATFSYTDTGLGIVSPVETVTCPTGLHAINGGVQQSQPDSAELNLSSEPNPSGGFLSLPRPVDNDAGWRMRFNARVLNGASIDVTLYAVCI